MNYLRQFTLKKSPSPGDICRGLAQDCEDSKVVSTKDFGRRIVEFHDTIMNLVGDPLIGVGKLQNAPSSSSSCGANQRRGAAEKTTNSSPLSFARSGSLAVPGTSPTKPRLSPREWRLRVLKGEEKYDAKMLQDYAVAVVEHDVLYRLIKNIRIIDFEARKEVVQISAKLISLPEILKHLISRGIISLLIDGYKNTEMALSYGVILRDLSKYPHAVQHALDSLELYRLFEFARSSNFEISSDSFFSLKEYLTKHKEISAQHIKSNFDEFFLKYHQMLSDNRNPNGSEEPQQYVTLRQGLKLLSDILLDKCFMPIMIKYVNQDEFLKIHMTLLRNESKSLQFEAFHVFKIFAANPQKTQRVSRILYQNREKLTKLLDGFLETERKDDAQFLQDKATVVQKLKLLTVD